MLIGSSATSPGESTLGFASSIPGAIPSGLMSGEPTIFSCRAVLDRVLPGDTDPIVAIPKTIGPPCGVAAESEQLRAFHGRTSRSIFRIPIMPHRTNRAKSGTEARGNRSTERQGGQRVDALLHECHRETDQARPTGPSDQPVRVRAAATA